MVWSATWLARTPEALVTVMSDSTTEGTRQWSRPAAEDWIQRRRPARTTSSHGTGTLAWPQKMSAVGSSIGDALLAGVDDVGMWRGGGDLVRRVAVPPGSRGRCGGASG